MAKVKEIKTTNYIFNVMEKGDGSVSLSVFTNDGKDTLIDHLTYGKKEKKTK